MSQQKTIKLTKNARKSSARLHAVQAVYQMQMTKDNAKDIVDEYVNHRLEKSMDELDGMQVNGAVFKQIVLGVNDRFSDLMHILKNVRGDQVSDIQKNDPLLHSVLLCGVYELITKDDVDPPIIISDYVSITQTFYDGGEDKLVNAILDKVNKVLNEDKE